MVGYDKERICSCENSIVFFFVWGTAKLYAKCPKLYKFIIFQYCSYNLLIYVIFKGYSGFVSVFFFLVIWDIHVYSWI